MKYDINEEEERDEEWTSFNILGGVDETQNQSSEPNASIVQSH